MTVRCIGKRSATRIPSMWNSAVALRSHSSSPGYSTDRVFVYTALFAVVAFVAPVIGWVGS
jgi:hypothetical protein